MLISILIVLFFLFWGGMLMTYFKEEIRSWLDNRYGPDHVSKEQEIRKYQKKWRRTKALMWYERDKL